MSTETTMRMLALLAAGLFGGSLLAADKKPKDEDAIVGRWKVEKMEYGKEREPTAEEVAKLEMVFTFGKDGKAIQSSATKEGKTDQKAEFEIDPSRKRKTIVLRDGNAIMIGIYELDGDTLKMCVAHGTPILPTELKAVEGAAMMMTLKREKEKKKDK
jgi:uncharacterized protein (TIGR03067 family)